jgi:hypothetical protein
VVIGGGGIYWILCMYRRSPRDDGEEDMDRRGEAVVVEGKEFEIFNWGRDAMVGRRHGEKNGFCQAPCKK